MKNENKTGRLRNTYAGVGSVQSYKYFEDIIFECSLCILFIWHVVYVMLKNISLTQRWSVLRDVKHTENTQYTMQNL